MQNYIFIISLFLVSMLHASFLAWSSFSSSSEAKLRNSFSNNSISINVKAYKKPKTQKSVLKKIKKKTLTKKTPQSSKPMMKNSSMLSKGKQGTNNEAQIIGSLTPTYPHLSKIYEEEGIVSLEAHISPSGVVKEVKLIKSSGFQRLDSSAINDLRKAKFIPATKDGKPVKSSEVININFSLQ